MSNSVNKASHQSLVTGSSEASSAHKSNDRSAETKLAGQIFLGLEKLDLPPSESIEATRTFNKTLKSLLDFTNKAEISTLNRGEQLRAAYRYLTNPKGLEFNPSGNSQNTVTEALNTKQLDCDTASIIMLSLAQSKGWEAELVTMPGHTIMSFQNEKNEWTNFDQGYLPPDSFYKGESLADGVLVYEAVGINRFSPSNIQRVPLSKLGSFAFSLIGVYQTRKGNQVGIIQANNHVLSSLPGNIAALTNRGMAYSDQQQWQLALADFQQAIQLEPHSPHAYYGKAVVLTNTGHFKEAAKLLNTSVGKALILNQSQLELLLSIADHILKNSENDHETKLLISDFFLELAKYFENQIQGNKLSRDDIAYTTVSMNSCIAQARKLIEEKK